MSAFGICTDCGVNTRPVLLIGGKCDYHRKNPGVFVERTNVLEGQKSAQQESKELTAFYNRHIKQLPAKCENCAKPIVMIPGLSKRTYVAHILPKKHFKSIATNDDNAFHFCWQCHHDWDEGNPRTMPIIVVARQRYELFKHLITDNEKKHLPNWIV